MSLRCLLFQPFGVTLYKLRWEIIYFILNSSTIFSRGDKRIIYKITKIVRTLWLAERRVCMTVCRHGCDVKMLCFSNANHERHRFEKGFELKYLTILLYVPISSSVETWKILRNMLCQFFFHLSWHFKQEKLIFWKASFLHNKDWLRVKASCTRLWDW